MLSAPIWLNVLNTAAPGAQRYLLTGRSCVAEREFQTIRPHAERIGAIDDDLAGEIAEALHRCLGGRPGCRKDNDFGTSSRFRRGAIRPAYRKWL
jgi:hypothetical protein